MSDWNNIKSKLDQVYNALQDEESKKLFDAKVQYMIDRDSEAYIDTIFELNEQYPKNWRCPEIENVLEDGQKIIIYGCGHDGKISERVLGLCGYPIAYWCDSNKNIQGTYINGRKVISPEDLKSYEDHLVIIGSRRYEVEIRRRLFDVGFPTKNIFVFAYNQGIALCGKQYFDMFLPEDEEVFIDAGAYNGDSANDFLEWVGDRKYKVYAIEPLADMCEVIINKNIPHVEVVNCMVWNRKEDLPLLTNGRGSSMDNDNHENIQGGGGAAIDEIVGDEKVSFIKMDIEGAELKALEGARECILKYSPRLAICIYHKAEDIYEIGNYILSLNPDYKLYIRHYTTCMWETVLYAI